MNNKNTMTSSIRHPDYKTEIATLLHRRLTPGRLREELMNYHENDIAAALELLSHEDRLVLYRLLSSSELADIFSYVDHPAAYLNELGMRQKLETLAQLEPAQAADYLAELKKEERDTLLDLLEEDTRSEIALLSSFAQEEIGSRMTTNYITIQDGSSVRQAMRALVEQAAENDNISTLYVVDDQERLVGAIDLKDLIMAREGDDLANITASSYPYVYATEAVEDCIDCLSDYSEDSIPVLDSANRLKGVLTAQVLGQLIGEELDEDYAKLGGLSAGEDLKEPLRRSILKRLPWLIILLGLGLVVSSVVGIFEAVVSQLTLIICFQSLVLDMAGNVGTQSLAVTIRVLTDSRVDARRKWALVGKEARIGLVNGAILGTLSFAAIGCYLMFFKGQPANVAFSISFCTGAALLLSMELSSIAGTTIPLLFKKLHVDPAVASGPLITTVNDLVAVVSYYGLAWFFLIYLAHL